MGFSWQEYWSGLPSLPSVAHILSELSTMTCPSWVALHGMAHSFIELDKAVVRVISLVSFLWLWFQPIWRRLWKLPYGRGWLRGKLGHILMGEAMLSKYLIWFSVDGWSCVPSLLFTQQDGSNGYVTLEHLKGDTLCPRAKEKLLQDGRRGKFTFRIKSNSRQKCSEGWNKLCPYQNPENPQRLTKTCVWVSSVEVGSAVDCRRGRGSGSSRLGYGIALLEEAVIYSTIELPELTQDWEINSWRAQTEPCVHQDPEERSSDPTRDWARFAWECPGVTGRGVGRRWQAAALRDLNVAAHAWDLLKEVAILFILNSIPLYGCTAHHLSIQLIQDTWVVLRFLVILTRAARNVLIQLLSECKCLLLKVR